MSEYEKIATLENEFEAQFLATMLDEQNIPYHIKSYHDLAYDGLFQMMKGWGAVYALPRHKDIIQELLDNLRKNEIAPD